MSQQSTIPSKLQFWMYRLSTIWKSFKTLYTLPPEKVNAFVKSYGVYDYDWADETQMVEKLGANYYQEIKQGVVDWYSVLNELCALGQVEKMYIPPAMDLSQSIIANQVLFERKMARDLGLAKGKKALDIGCGRGRVASHMATFSGVQMTGINVDPTQLEHARKFALGNGLSEQCKFQLRDFNDLPFPFADQSFDAIYQIQAFSISKDLLKLLKELHRILKPGGRVGCLDWVKLPNYDEKNPHHLNLMRRIKPLIGAIGTVSVEEYTRLFEQAGFKVIISENPSVDGTQAALIDNADRFFTRVTRIVKFLVKCKILPAHFVVLFDRLTQDGQALVEADRDKLVSTCYYFVAEKV